MSHDEACEACEGTGCHGCQPDRFRLEHVKWLADGATTLATVSHALRSFADELDELDRQGWKLTDPVDGGWINLEREGP